MYTIDNTYDRILNKQLDVDALMYKEKVELDAIIQLSQQMKLRINHCAYIPTEKDLELINAWSELIHKAYMSCREASIFGYK